MTVIPFARPTYCAKAFHAGKFLTSGTLDGFVDFATPHGTYQFDLDEARLIVAALNGVIADIKANCLYDSDPLLEPCAD